MPNERDGASWDKTGPRSTNLVRAHAAKKLSSKITNRNVTTYRGILEPLYAFRICQSEVAINITGGRW